MQVINRSLKFFLIPFILFAAASASWAAEWELLQDDVKKGAVAVLERNGSTFAALDQMLSNLGFAQSDVSGGLVVTFSGKKLEFWSGSNVARISGSVYTFPANVFSEGGHWWGEATASIRVMEQFLQAVGRPAGLRWVRADGGTASTSTLAPVAPPVLAPSTVAHTAGGSVAISGVRWGQQTEAYRAVIDVSDEVPVSLKELPGALEASFPGASTSSFEGGNSPWSPLAVSAKNSSGTAVLTFTHNASRVKSFWLQSPSRYVIDFYFGGSSSGAPATSISTSSTGSPETSPQIPTPPTASGRFLVVVDAGHGGHDPGAAGNGLKEKDINLKAALQLAASLKKLGLDVRMTRADDRYLKLAERTAFANNADADIFISLHCNALPKGKHASGMELYLMAEPSDKDAMNLAILENRELSSEGGSGAEATAAADQKTRLLLKILGDMQQNDKISESTTMAEFLYKRAQNAGISLRKVRQAPFFVLRGAGMPAVLVEMGYITEQKDAQLLNSEAYRSKIVDNLAAGILDYLSRAKKGGRR